MKAWRASVQQLPGSIGYVEYAYAMQNQPHLHQADQQGGQDARSQSIDTFKAAAASADWVGASSQAFNMVLVDQPGANAWPITGATWVIVYKNPPDKAATANALKFFKWAYENGDAAATSLDYVALPENAVKAIEASWKSIQGSGM